MTRKTTRVRVLTLWRPWDQLILEGSKTFENRPQHWDVTGTLLALHAGQSCDRRCLEPREGSALYERTVAELGPGWAAHTDRRAGFIVGAAMVVACGEPWRLGLRDPWATGPFGLLLADRVAFPERDWMRWRGRQGITSLPADLEARVVAGWNLGASEGRAR